MRMTAKDAKILRVAIVPAFILSSIVGAIAIMSFSISAAVNADSGGSVQDRAVIERAMKGSELARTDRNLMR